MSLQMCIAACWWLSLAVRIGSASTPRSTSSGPIRWRPLSEVLGHKEVAITLDRYRHRLPTLGVEAMGRLDAVLGRSSLDAPDKGPTQAASAELWVDEEPAAWSISGSDGDKGPDKGPNAARRALKRPDLNSDRADEGEVGTAYRIRTGDLRLERAVS
jgi:hypothetical protein